MIGTDVGGKHGIQLIAECLEACRHLRDLCMMGGAALREADWSGWVIVEVNRRDDMSSDELVLKARNHLRQTMEI